MNNRIDFAFIDSGTGGIPYMLYLKKLSPESRCVYVGDTANFPYGEKTPDQIFSCVSKVISRIVNEFNPRCLIIACNTISVTSLVSLREEFPDLPIVGTVPAIKLAANTTRNKCIGLLATNATVNNEYSARLEKEFASDCTVVRRGDPDLIAFIEHKLFTSSKEERLAAVAPAVDFFKKNGCDTIILGCTHFTHVADYIQEYAGEGMFVVDSRDGVGRHALDVLSKTAGTTLAGQEKDLPADTTFFATALKDESDDREYAVLCKNAGIPWGGLF